MDHAVIRHQRITTASGEVLVVLSLEDFEDLVDAVSAQNAARVPGERLTSGEMRDLLAAPTPLRFWRKRRGLTQADLAAHVGASQNFLSDIESGKSRGDVALLRRLADALGVSLDDLVPADVPAAATGTDG